MLSELLTELEVRRKDREVDFMAIAWKLATGERVATTTVEKLLVESGKSPGELSETVELIKRRLQWNERYQKAASLEKQRSAFEDRIAAEDHKLAVAEKAHSEATAPMYARVREIKAAVNDASEAQRQLITTCMDVKLKGELANTQARLNALRNQEMTLRQRAELIKRAERDEEEARMHEQGFKPGSDPRKAPLWREQAVRDRKAGEQALAELPGVQKQIVALEREEAAMYERMTKP